MLDITQFLDENFDQTPAGDDIMINCPYCLSRVGESDTKRHLGVSLTRQVVHCFRCDYSRSWVGFVMDYTGVDYHIALGKLYRKPKLKEMDGILDKLNPAVIQPKDFAKLPKGYKLIQPDRSRPSMFSAYRYLQKRGFGNWHIDHYNLGIADADNVQNRIIIPIEEGYWQARAIYPWMSPKYINPNVEAGDLLFNSQALGMYKEVVVCEGAFSAMAVGENAIALISKEPTKERMERLLSSQVEHFIIALEPGAFTSMRKLADNATRAGRRVTIWRYSTGDPADPAGKFTVIDYSLRNKLEIIMGEQPEQARRKTWKKAWLNN